MVEDKAAGQLAREELILAAIALFAEIGVDAVTLRMINRAAGHKNNSSLHYHFGSKDGLVEAVSEFIQSHFDALREPALSTLEAAAETGPVGVREIMQAFVEPYLRVIQDYEWGYAAVRTIARMEFDGDLRVREHLSKSARRVMQRLSRLHRAALPRLGPEEFNRRFNHVVTSTILGFADYRSLGSSYLGDLSVASLPRLGDFYVSVGAAVLMAPPEEPDASVRGGDAPRTP